MLFSLIILVQCGTSGLGPVAGGFPAAAQPPHHHCASVTGAREEEKGGEFREEPKLTMLATPKEI